MAFSYQYAKEYQVLVVNSDEGEREWDVGKVERVTQEYPQRVYSIKVTFNPRQNTLSEPDIAEDTPAEEKEFKTKTGFSMEKHQRQQQAIGQYCSQPPSLTDGHPVSFLNVICARSDKTEITVDFRKKERTSWLISFGYR